jgi:hypothetical protein
MTNGDTQGVSQHFLKFHTDLNFKIRTLKVLPGATILDALNDYTRV